MPKSRLIWQIYPAYLLIVLLAFFVLAGYASHALRRFYYEETATHLDVRAQLLATGVQGFLAAADYAGLDRWAKTVGTQSDTRVTVILPSGRVAADSHEAPSRMDDHADRPEIAKAMSGVPGTAVRDSVTLGQAMMYHAIPVRRDGRVCAVIRASVSVSAVHSVLGRIRQRLVWAGVLITVLTAALSLLVSRRIMRPVENIRRGAERFAAGDLEFRLAPQGSGEIVALAETLNRMAAQLRGLETMRRDFVANVSHELKTPITAIKGFVETLQDGALEKPADAKRFMEVIARNADRLGAIVSDLLTLARIEQESEHGRLAFVDAPLSDVVAGVVELCRPMAAAKHIEISADCPENLVAPMNAQLLEQALANLIDNAVKYSEPKTNIALSVTRAGGEIQVTVADQGVGIPAEHLPRIFERFYRVDKGRSRRLGGTGLGLAIVKHIANAHGGRVTVESRPGKGSRFTLHLRTSDQTSMNPEPT